MSVSPLLDSEPSYAPATGRPAPYRAANAAASLTITTYAPGASVAIAEPVKSNVIPAVNRTPVRSISDVPTFRSSTNSKSCLSDASGPAAGL